MKHIASKDALEGRKVLAWPSVRTPEGAFFVAGVVGAGVIMGIPPSMFGPGLAWGGPVLVCAVFLAMVGVGAVALGREYPHDRLGLCNLVTLTRLVIVGVLAVALLEGTAPGGIVLALAIVSLSLDGADGWLARREGLVSSFGARFDVEVDAAFALVLSLYAARTGFVGPHVILLGLPYYAFMIACAVFPYLRAPLPERFSRKAVCVAQIAVLIVLFLPGLPSWLAEGMVLTVIGVLAWSFGRDIRWLYRNRA